MIEVNSNVLFLSTFGVKIDVKNERKRVSRMWENAYLSIKNPKASRALKRALDPGPQIARFACATPLHYIGNFRPQKLGPPPWPNPGSAPVVVWICLHKREIFISHGKWLVACEWPNRLIRNCVSCNWVSYAVCPKTLCLLPIFCILWELSSWKHYIPMNPDIGSILTKIFPHSIHIISPNLTQSLVKKI